MTFSQSQNSRAVILNKRKKWLIIIESSRDIFPKYIYSDSSPPILSKYKKLYIGEWFIYLYFKNEKLLGWLWHSTNTHTQRNSMFEGQWQYFSICLDSSSWESYFASKPTLDVEDYYQGVTFSFLQGSSLNFDNFFSSVFDARNSYWAFAIGKTLPHTVRYKKRWTLFLIF